MQINPIKKLEGEFFVPGDKSISHRAIILGSISEGVTEIDNFLEGYDCLSTVSCFKDMGIEIGVNKNKVKVYGKGMRGLRQPKNTLDVGNSGTTLRILTGLLSAQDFNSCLDGDESIRKRPVQRVITPLKLMGANIENNSCPIIINGSELSGINYKLKIASAQLKSAILFASLYASSDTVIKEIAKSRNHTELMINYFGGNIRVDNLNIYSAPVSELNAQHIVVPGDISSAAYLIVAGLILENSEIVIKNVGINPTRSGIIDVLTKMGGNISIENLKIVNNEPIADIIVKSSELTGTNVYGDIIPNLIDEIPILAVAACFSKGKTVIRNAEELKVKESNRITAMVKELKKMGADIKETYDGMVIEGGRELRGSEICTYNDHRIAMSMFVAALKSSSVSHINDEKVVNISFPGFFDIFNIAVSV